MQEKSAGGQETAGRTVKSAFFSFSTVLMLIGFAVYFTPDLVRTYLAPRPAADLASTLHIGANGFRFVGQFMITVFGLDLLLKFPWSMDYVEDRMKSVIHSQRDFFNELIEAVLKRKISSEPFLREMPTDVLDDTHARIVEIQTGKPFTRHGTFYHVVRDKIEPLLGLPHVDEINFDMTFELKTTDSGTPYLFSTRRIVETMHAASPQWVKEHMGKTIRAVKGVKEEDLYKLESFKVRNMEHADRLSPLELSSDKTHYSVKLDFEYEIGKSSDGSDRGTEHVIIERQEEIALPIEDVFDWRVSERMTCRCVNLSVRFINVDAYPKVLVYGLETPNDEWTCEPVVGDPRKCSIRWRGWMLPQHSLVVTWNQAEIMEQWNESQKAVATV